MNKKRSLSLFFSVGHRFFNFFYEGGKIIKSQKVSRKDLEKAKTIKKNYITRVKGGVYYEKS
ncbi:MAG: hypothetical protein ABIK26_03345 [Candidatus Omnitrophota bacterium]